MTAPRRLRWALHAFPRRFRAQRSAEIETTFHESALAGDPDTYGAAAIVDVVRAGWLERARSRPPLGRYLKYRLLNGRLAPRWHGWMLDDLDGWFAARRVLWFVAMYVLMVVVLQRFVGGPPLLPLTIGTAVGASLTTRLERRRILWRHGYDPRTRSWMPPSGWPSPTVRRIPRAAPALVGTGAALLVVAPFAAVALFAPGWSVRSVTIGTFSFSRVVDDTVAIGWSAVAVGVVVLGAGMATHQRIARRVLVPADAVEPTQLVVMSAGPLIWSGPTVIVVVGVVASVLPITPLAVPAAFLAAGVVSPVLFAIANTAHRLERSESTTVGFTTAARRTGARSPSS